MEEKELKIIEIGKNSNLLTIWEFSPETPFNTKNRVILGGGRWTSFRGIKIKYS